MANHPTESALTDEQYPLLKVTAGAGDTQPANAPNGWAVTCPQRRSWKEKWPEFVSACWMTIILVSICLLGLYTLGMAVARRQAVMVQYFKDNEIQRFHIRDPESEVFYHHVIDRGSSVPLLIYSDYLRLMSISYPNLRFNVIFLIDDTVQSFPRWPRHNRFINKLIPATVCKMDKNMKREISNFQKKNPNVNITVMSLTKYMSTTPFKNKLNNVPLSYMKFYARVYTIWQRGGIGMDLPTVYDKIVDPQNMDAKMHYIFKNHNNGVKKEEREPLRKDGDNEFSMLFDCLNFVINQAWNETRALFNNSLSWSPIPSNEEGNQILSRVHRNKRELLSINETTSQSLLIAPGNGTILGDYNSSISTNTSSTLLPISEFSLQNNTSNDNITTTKINNNKTMIQTRNVSEPFKLPTFANATEMKAFEIPQLMLLYDFSIIADDFYKGFNPPPIYNNPLYNILPEPQIHREFNMNFDFPKKTDDFSKQLTIDTEGKFIATYARFHPFLAHLMSTGYRHLSPKLCIGEGILTHCPDDIHRDSYCDTIEFL